jgi:hypothetical protein
MQNTTSNHVFDTTPLQSEFVTQYFAPELLDILSSETCLHDEYADTVNNAVSQTVPPSQCWNTEGGDEVVIRGLNFGPLGTPLDGHYGTSAKFAAGKEYHALGMGGEEDPTVCEIIEVPEAPLVNYTARCTVSPGVGTKLLWRFTVKKQKSELFYDGSSYGLPVIESIEVVNATRMNLLSTVHTMRTKGGETIWINGRNFGGNALQASNLHVTYGSVRGDVNSWGDRYPADACEPLANSLIQCRSIPGTSHSHHFRVHVEGQINNVYWSEYGDRSVPFLDYTAPVIHKIDGPGAHNASTAGGQVLEIFGEDFGPAGPLVGSVVHGLPRFGNPLLQMTYDLGLEDNGLTSKGEADLDRDSANVQLCEANDPTKPCSKWYNSDGTDPSNRDECGCCLGWTSSDPSDPSKKCDVCYNHFSEAKQHGSLHKSHDSIGQPAGDPSWTGNEWNPATYDRGHFHTPYTMDNDHVTVDPLLLCDSRLNKVFDAQADFRGLVKPTRDSLLPGPNGPALYGSRAMDCYVTTPHEVIKCFSGEGTGVAHWWIVEVEDLYTPPTWATKDGSPNGTRTSYAVPVIEDLTGPGVDANTAGGEVVYVTGRDFGSKHRNLVTRVIYGRINSDLWFDAVGCKVIKDHVMLECKTAPGAGKDLQWRVTIDHQQSLLQSTNYGKPEIFGIVDIDSSPSCKTPECQESPTLIRSHATEGNEIVILKGKNFGPRNQTAENGAPIRLDVTYGPTGHEYVCKEPRVIDAAHTRLKCTTSPGVGGVMKWKVYVHDQESVVSSWWTQYFHPKIERVVFPIDTSVKEAETTVLKGISGSGLFGKTTDERAMFTSAISTSGTDVMRIWGYNFGVTAALNGNANIKVHFDGVDYDPLESPSSEEIVPFAMDTQTLCVRTDAGVATDCKSMDYIDFRAPAGQGKGKWLTVIVDAMCKNFTMGNPCDQSEATKRRTLVKRVDYRAPYIKGVETFEGKASKLHLTLFVPGDSFGGVEVAKRNLWVSQTYSDFELVGEGRTLAWQRIGGLSRDEYARSCRVQEAVVTKVDEGEATLKQCINWQGPSCSDWAKVEVGGSTIAEFEGVPIAQLQEGATEEGAAKISPNSKVHAILMGDQSVPVAERTCKHCAKMCKNRRVGKHSCEWDAANLRCQPHWGVQQKENVVNATDWTHGSVELQYIGDYIQEPGCIPDPNVEMSCMMMKGFVEIDIAEDALKQTEPGTEDRVAPLQHSKPSYFVHYSPQVWAIGATTKSINASTNFVTEKLLTTAVVAGQYNDSNVTRQAFYKRICGDDPFDPEPVEPYSLPQTVDFGEKDGPLQIWNNWCGPCVGGRKCHLVNEHVVNSTDTTTSPVCPRAREQLPSPITGMYELIEPPVYIPTGRCGADGHLEQGENGWLPDAGVCGRDDNCLDRSKEILSQLWYPTIGGSTVKLYGRYMSENPEQMRIMVAPPKWNGNKFLLSRAIVTAAAKIDQKDKVFSVSFQMPVGQGKENEVFVYRGSQPSGAVYVSYRPPVITKTVIKDCPEKSMPMWNGGMEKWAYMCDGGDNLWDEEKCKLTPELNWIPQETADSMSPRQNGQWVQVGPAVGDCRRRATTCTTDKKQTDGCQHKNGCSQDGYVRGSGDVFEHVAPRRCDTALTCGEDEFENCADRERNSSWTAYTKEDAKEKLIVSTLGGTIVIYGTDLGVGGELGKSNKIISVDNTFTTTDASKCSWVQYPIKDQPIYRNLDDGDQFCEKNVRCMKGGAVQWNGNPETMWDLSKACYCRTKMECVLPPGQGANHEFQVEIGGQRSNSWFFSYAAPVVEYTNKGNKPGYKGSNPANRGALQEGTEVNTNATDPGQFDQEVGEAVLKIWGRNFGLDEDHMSAQNKQTMKTLLATRLRAHLDDPEIKVGAHIKIGPHVCRITDHHTEHLLCGCTETERRRQLIAARALTMEGGAHKDMRRRTEQIETFPCLSDPEFEGYQAIYASHHDGKKLHRPSDSHRATATDGRAAPVTCRTKKDSYGTSTAHMQGCGYQFVEARGTCQYVPGYFTCEIPQGQGWRALSVTVGDQTDDSVQFRYASPIVERYVLESGYNYGRTDGLTHEGGEADIITIYGSNFGRDGFQFGGEGGGFWEQYGWPRLMMVTQTDRMASVDTDRFNTEFLNHTHNMIKLQLPKGRGGTYPMTDLRIEVHHTDMTANLGALSNLTFGPGTAGLQRNVAGVLTDLCFDTSVWHKFNPGKSCASKSPPGGWKSTDFDGISMPRYPKYDYGVPETPSDAVFSYQIPSYLSIQNLHYDPQMYWKRRDGGSTDGYYAVLHGANFGEGCTSLNEDGTCIEVHEETNAKGQKVRHSRFAMPDEKILGKIRYMSMNYEDNDPKTKPDYKIVELDGAKMGRIAQGIISDPGDVGHPKMAPGGISPYSFEPRGDESLITADVPGMDERRHGIIDNVRTRSCSCTQNLGPGGIDGDGCDLFQVDASCAPIRSWNHTHIVFWVDSGVGARLPIQVETGGQKSCEFAPIGGDDNHGFTSDNTRLQWAEPRLHTKQAQFCSNRPKNSPKSGLSAITTTCHGRRVTSSSLNEKDGLHSEVWKKHGDKNCTHTRNYGLDFDDIQRSKCFCLAQYGQPAATQPKPHNNKQFPDPWKRSVDFEKKYKAHAVHDPFPKDDKDENGAKTGLKVHDYTKYFDTWTNKNLWTWEPSDDVVNHGQVTINYDLPVILKITPDTLTAHSEISIVKFNQMTPEEQAAEINQTTGNLFEIGTEDAYEIIKVSGENMGSKKNRPIIQIDEMECLNAEIVDAEGMPPTWTEEQKNSGPKTLNCMAPISEVGPKGYDPELPTRTKMRLNVLVGGQYAIVSPKLEPVTKLNLLKSECRRGHYGQRFEKCVACPAPATTPGTKPGAECMGGVGPQAEPIAASGWFSTPLIKDDITWAGNQTRDCDYCKTVMKRFEPLQLTETYMSPEEKAEMKEFELRPFLRRHLDEYTSFCNMTNLPNSTMCASGEDPSTTGCVPFTKYPPSSFWIGKDHKSCVHWYEPDHPKNTDGKPSAELCEGNGRDCCLSRWCSMSDPHMPHKHGWSFVQKRWQGESRITEPGEKRRLSRTLRESTNEARRRAALKGTQVATELRELAASNTATGPQVAEGCIVPIVYGDPRFYETKEYTDDVTGVKSGDCQSSTHGWYVWEEDRVTSGRLPKRVKEQELLDCNFTTWSDPLGNLKLGTDVRTFDAQIKERVPPGGIATLKTLCLDVVNRRTGAAEKKSMGNAARDAATQMSRRLRSIFGVGDFDKDRDADRFMAAMQKEHEKDMYERRRLNASSMPSGADSPSGSDGGDALVGAVTGADNRCHSDRWDRSTCPYVVPCEPAEACAGDNVCANGYTGMKCSKCMEGFSRQDGYCVECAGNPMIMILFIAAGAAIAGVVYWVVVVLLKINIGVISIGIDYFQIIGLFASQQIPWPNIMRSLFSYLQVFSFDLGMLGLECGGLKPHEMWFLIMLVPLGVLALLIGGVMLNILQLYLCKARKLADELRKDLADGHFDGNEHMDSGLKEVMKLVEKRIGLCMTLFLTVFYLMYVQITKKAMDIFNCAAADPPDDPNNPTTYMTIAPDQECWRPGTWETGTHVKIMPWALVFVIVYSLAFPLFIYCKFSKNKLKIFEDQLLMAQDRGDKPETNVNFAFRHRYSSMYKNYKPQYWGWSIIVLSKKLAVCFTGLMFRRNPSFQLAVALMVLFVAFTLQVLNKPFMSMDERADIVRLASRRDFERGNRMLRKMSAFGDQSEIERAKKRLAMEEQAQLTIARALTIASKYFVNYNKVEAVFLGCAIYVCLAGVMFSSGYFDNPLFTWQRTFLGIFTAIVVATSTGFYLYVVGLEITGVRKYRRQKNKAKWTAFKKKAHFHKDLFNLNNSNASSEEKQAASVIEACMKGRLERAKLHDRITNSGTEEEKAILARVEARVDIRRKKARAARMAKKSSGSLFGGLSAKKSTAIVPASKTTEKKKKLKKKKTKIKKKKTKRKEDNSEEKADVSAKETGTEARSKGKDLASWGDDGDDY